MVIGASKEEVEAVRVAIVQVTYLLIRSMSRLWISTVWWQARFEPGKSPVCSSFGLIGVFADGIVHYHWSKTLAPPRDWTS